MAKLAGYMLTWTKGFDKRFCFTQDDLARKIAYIRNHKLPTMLSSIARNGGN